MITVYVCKVSRGAGIKPLAPHHVGKPTSNPLINIRRYFRCWLLVYQTTPFWVTGSRCDRPPCAARAAHRTRARGCVHRSRSTRRQNGRSAGAAGELGAEREIGVCLRP